MTPTPQRIAATLLLVLACAGCQPASRAGNGSTEPPPAQPAADAGTKQPTTTITGHATYRERIKMPPGASLHVELVVLDDATPRVVASTRKPDVAGPPIPFLLPVQPSRIDTARRYGLRAELIGPDGGRWMATSESAPVVPGASANVELLLRRSTTSAAPADPTTSSTAARHWECGDLGVMSRFAADASNVRLDANGRTWMLPLARSASGTRYADGAGTEFWTKGATGTLTIDREPPRDCVIAREPSPWNAALLRGIAFRAVGNEPGWFVEVHRGEAPQLRATLDYGERTLTVDDLTPRAEGFTGTAGQDTVTLDVRRRECADGMSGQRFEATATLQVGARRYTGCGAWLAD